MRKIRQGLQQSVRGDTPLIRIFGWAGIVWQWLLPLAIASLTLSTVLPGEHELVYFYTGMYILFFHVIYVALVLKNRHNRSARGMPAFSAIILVGWPIYCVLAGLAYYFTRIGA